jgi:PTS system nitrogen regulatory IIA component
MNELLTIREVAKMLKLSTFTIREYAKKGIIPARKVGQQWRFQKDDVVEWFNSQGKGDKDK